MGTADERTERDGATSKPGRLAFRIARGAAVASGVAMVGGPAGVHLDVLAPLQAFGAFSLGVVGLLVVLIAGIVGVVRRRRVGGALARLDLGLIAIAAVGFASVVIVAQQGRSAPPINDVTTDLADPPVFIGEDEAGYPEDFRDPAEEHYGDLSTLTLEGISVDAAVEAVEGTFDELGLVAVRREADPADGVRIQGEAVTTVFRFVDDVVVRVRDGAGGALVDVRSRSRDGKSDLGANADRIERLLDDLSDRAN